MSQHDLRQLAVTLNNLIAQQKAKSSKQDPIRNQLNADTQGYVLNPRVIYSEIIRPESPFMIKDDAGEFPPSSSLRKIARQISDDLYKEYKLAASKYKTFNVTGKKLPNDFFDSSNITVAFDDKQKIIYFRGTKGDNFESFRGALRAPVEKKIQARTNVTDPTRVFVAPDESWMDEFNKIKLQIKAQGEEDGLSPKAIESRIGRAKKKFLEGDTYYEGLDAGHTFGSKVYAAAGLLQNRHDVAHADLDHLELLSVIPPDIKPELLKVVRQIIEYDSELRWERIFNRNDVAGKFTLLIPESKVNNRATGGKVGRLSQDFLKPIVEQLAVLLPDLEGSPSYNQLLTKYVEDLFLGKNIGRRKYTTRITSKDKVSRDIALRKMEGAKVKVRRKRQQSRGISGRDLVDRVINPRLHDKIKENMGKGNSKKILNYRTGRFAKSAKAIDLKRGTEKGALTAIVKYRKDPYAVFEKGGRLHLPGRDPARIFGRSIRQILAEEKIANLRRVQVELRG